MSANFLHISMIMFATQQRLRACVRSHLRQSVHQRLSSNRRIHWFTYVSIGLLALCMAQPRLDAQIITPPPAGPNTVVGVVVDTADFPIADVTVMLRALGRQTRTLPDGTFRFDSVPAGTHEISARGVGLIVGVQPVVVGPRGGAARIMMFRFGSALAAMVTTATRGGLGGVIADTSYQALPEVTITAVGGAEVATTDSLGAFFMPLKPGRYLLRLDKEGYARQTVGVTIPETEGRRIAAWLKPQEGPTDHMMGKELFDLNERMLRVSPVSTKFMTREDMEEQSIVDLRALAARYSTGRITQECLVKIGGTYNTMVPLGSLTASDIEFVEVYLPTTIGSVRSGTSINKMETKITTSTFDRPPARAECGNVGFVAWLRN